MSFKNKKQLNKNYSTRNFKTLENENNYNSEYATTYNCSNLNDFSDEDSFDEILEENNFYNTIDSFYNQAKIIEDQKKEIEDFHKCTNNKVSEIQNYYYNKKQDNKNKYTIKKENIMSDYKKILGLEDYFDKKDVFYRFFMGEEINKLEALEKKMDSEYNNFLETIDKKRDKKISSYRAQRELEYEQLIKKHKKYI